VSKLWRRRVEPFYRQLFFAYARWRRGMTLGVRGVVTDSDGRVLLIQHTYIPGWHLPGGGVDRGETTEAALVRELVEEAGVQVAEPPRLLSVHSNERYFRGDHVLVYRVGAWEPCAATSRGEIHEVGWFAPDALPDGTSRATRARIREAMSGGPAATAW
jgi:8-oxo-dGTP pyrophosphatase MutT (NUDIX family)